MGTSCCAPTKSQNKSLRKELPTYSTQNKTEETSSAPILTEPHYVQEDLNGFMDYEFGREIGHGAYATVYEAVHTPTNTTVALKVQAEIFEDITTAKRVLREICLLRSLAHPCIVRLHDVYIPYRTPSTRIFDSLCMAFEIGETSIDKFLKSPYHLKPAQVQLVMYNICRGVLYMHSAGVIHRDIKPANILINSDCSVRICDFGLARTASTERAVRAITTEANEEFRNHLSQQQMIKNLGKVNRKFTLHVATRWYRAPEIIMAHGLYGPAVDIWAIGCIFAELLSMLKAEIIHVRQPLFPGQSCLGISPMSIRHKPAGSTDQLEVIFETLGTPKPEDIAFIKDESVLARIKQFPKVDPIDFKSKYPAAGDSAISLLQKMLVINPDKRCSIEECLSHPYFSSIQDPDLELRAEEPIELDPALETDRNRHALLRLFHKEIDHYLILRKQKKLYLKQFYVESIISYN